jgi:hypothetical protein
MDFQVQGYQALEEQHCVLWCGRMRWACIRNADTSTEQFFRHKISDLYLIEFVNFALAIKPKRMLVWEVSSVQNKIENGSDVWVGRKAFTLYGPQLKIFYFILFVRFLICAHLRIRTSLSVQETI